MTQPARGNQHGYLILAVISGYTAFLAGTELDHSHAILADLLEVVFGHYKTLPAISQMMANAARLLGEQLSRTAPA
jgi:hypothetical protein